MKLYLTAYGSQLLKGRDNLYLVLKALRLNVLSVGPQLKQINSVESKSILHEFPEVTQRFSKLKDFKLKIPIDRNIQPVIQPVRRVPYHLRE